MWHLARQPIGKLFVIQPEFRQEVGKALKLVGSFQPNLLGGQAVEEVGIVGADEAERPAAELALEAGEVGEEMIGRAERIVVGGIDAIVSRRRYLKGVRMTKQEVKDDMRNTEGNPAIKGEVRRRMFRMSRMRMMAEVVNASVVLTNPTHYAVALRYDDDDPAPVVVAKGAGETALRIRAKAAEHGVPVVEDKPLAQTLFRSTEIGDTIPAPLYEAVARVLVVLWRAKGAA